jgi:hypothetical protein
MSRKHANGNIWIDSIFATLFIYLFMYLISNISAFKIFDAFDSIGQALQDMEMTDIAFSKMRSQPKMEDKIVLVNIGNLPRAGIAEQIRILDKYEPKVIGIDSFFKGYVGDTLGTLSLANAINSAKSDIVMVAKVEQSDSLEEVSAGEEIYDRLYVSDSIFTSNAEFAIANLDTDAAFQEDVKICRKFPSFREVLKGERQFAFGAILASKVNPNAIEELISRDKEFETINYRGDFYNFFDQDTTVFKRFAALDYYEVLGESFEPAFIKDKIIILGFIGEDFQDMYSWEDKFFTPLNKKMAGRSTPDMYGPVIHANIASMVLNDDYVNTLSETTENIIGVVLCYVNVLLFSLIYRKMGAWYDGLTKLIQVVEVMVILFVIIQLFASFSFKLELSIGLFAVALAGDLLEVYYGIIRNVAYKLQDRATSRRNKLVDKEI